MKTFPQTKRSKLNELESEKPLIEVLLSDFTAKAWYQARVEWTPVPEEVPNKHEFVNLSVMQGM